MAQRGKPSIAHEYDKNDCCIHCYMYKVNAERLSHVCTVQREKLCDEREAEKQGISVQQYQLHESYVEIEKRRIDGGDNFLRRIVGKKKREKRGQ